jgi:hypothetical protein
MLLNFQLSKISNNNNNNNNNMPVIIGAPEIVTKHLSKNLETMPGKHSIDSLKRQLYLERHT